jgi:hypothetical protein
MFNFIINFQKDFFKMLKLFSIWILAQLSYHFNKGSKLHFIYEAPLATEAMNTPCP